MSERELRAVAEAISPYIPDMELAISRTAISASDSQYVNGLVEALKECRNKAKMDEVCYLHDIDWIVQSALQNLPEDLR